MPEKPPHRPRHPPRDPFDSSGPSDTHPKPSRQHASHPRTRFPPPVKLARKIDFSRFITFGPGHTYTAPPGPASGSPAGPATMAEGVELEVDGHHDLEVVEQVGRPPPAHGSHGQGGGVSREGSFDGCARPAGCIWAWLAHGTRPVERWGGCRAERPGPARLEHCRCAATGACSYGTCTTRGGYRAAAPPARGMGRFAWQFPRWGCCTRCWAKGQGRGRPPESMWPRM